MKLTFQTMLVKEAMRDIERYAEAKVQGVKKVIVETGADIQSEAISRAPEDEGNLKNSIELDITNNGFAAEVNATAEYAADVEFGTKPHKITAKDGGVLAFQKDGKTVFAKSVNHPGTKAQPFLFPAWKAKRPQYLKDMIAELRKVK